MALTLSPATEQRIQRETARGPYTAPDDLIAHALDLIEAERTTLNPTPQAMNEWLLLNKEAINARLDESFAAKERGESFSPEEARAILTQRRQARQQTTLC